MSPGPGIQVRETPSETAPVRPFVLSESTCFVVTEVRGDWLRVQEHVVCAQGQGEARGDPAWMRWRKDGTLRVDYSLLC